MLSTRVHVVRLTNTLLSQMRSLSFDDALILLHEGCYRVTFTRISPDTQCQETTDSKHQETPFAVYEPSAVRQSSSVLAQAAVELAAKRKVWSLQAADRECKLYEFQAAETKRLAAQVTDTDTTPASAAVTLTKVAPFQTSTSSSAAGNFVERPFLLHMLRTQLANQYAPLMVMTGPPGSGKTTFVRELVERDLMSQLLVRPYEWVRLYFATFRLH
jgi:flagellar biosynthesis GTPase FlhF